MGVFIWLRHKDGLRFFIGIGIYGITPLTKTLELYHLNFNVTIAITTLNMVTIQKRTAILLSW